MSDAERPELPGADVHPVRRTIRYWLVRAAIWMATRALFRIEFVGRRHLPKGPAVYCFNHMSWIDPFVLMAVLPIRPRLYFFGPKEEEMSVGGRNRLMSWSGATIPYKPGKNDLLEATRRTSLVFKAGGVLGIAGEGRIHAREDELLPLNEGAAFFAMRSGVPLVPVAIRGTSWLAFGAAGPGRGGGAGPGQRPPEPRGRRGRHPGHLAGAPRPRRRRPRAPGPGTLRALAHRAVQRMARGFARGDARRHRRWTDPDGSPAGPRRDRRLTSGILGPVETTGLSTSKKEYRARLAEQSDDQIDAWTAELMRDVAIRRGVIKVIKDFRKAAKLDERGFERVFASGGGPPAVIGRDAKGRLMVPAITLFAIAPGIRSQVPDARERLIEYLVENFEEIVYV